MKVRVAWAVSVYIFPCLDGVEMEFCGGDTDDGTIFVVEKFVFEGDSAFQESLDSRDGRDCV
jgi:hypothetical protein